VLELARCEWIDRRENVIALGPSGTGKTHIALGLGLSACQKGLSVGFVTAAALVHELMEARDAVMGESLPDPALRFVVRHELAIVLLRPTVPVGGNDPNGRTRPWIILSASTYRSKAALSA